MCEYIKVFWKNTIIWKITRIVKEVLCQKSIFSVSQNTKWNEKKFAPKIIQNVVKNKNIFLPKMYHYSVLSTPTSYLHYLGNIE
jgi:hypothetical protein